MERLDFILPKWRRMMWSSENARTTWEPRIDSIGEALYRVKLETVRRGLCTAAIVEYPVFELYRLPLQLSKMNLSTIPIGGDGGLVKGVVFAPDSLKEVSAALESNDNKAIGRMLGYPECCIDFFVDQVIANDFQDTIWLSASNASEPNERTIELNSDQAINNLILGTFDLSPVFHVAHSFDCRATRDMAEKHIGLAIELGFEEEMKWFREVSSWPMEWSALHGIAEIKTPIFKVSMNTDATGNKYSVRVLGSSYPDEGGTGLSFPFNSPRKKFVTGSASQKRFMEAELLPVIDNSWLYKDNDFSSLDAMKKHHEPIVETLKTLVNKESSVLDLGCGNGFLLKRAIESGLNIQPYGIDIVGSRIQNAHSILPDFKENFIVGDISDYPWSHHYNVVILMPGRLLEMNQDKSSSLLELIRNRSDKVLLYAYGDWIQKYGCIENLCKKAGIKISGEILANDVVEVIAIDSHKL